jgi:DNA-binding transcriptional LysR family regulator
VEIQTTLSLVAAGNDLSIVPRCIGNLQRKDVVFRRLTGVRARTELLVAYRERDRSPVVQTFLKVLWRRVLAQKRGKSVEKKRLMDAEELVHHPPKD